MGSQPSLRVASARRLEGALIAAIAAAHLGGVSCAGRSESRGSGGSDTTGGAQSTGATSGRTSMPGGGTGGTVGGMGSGAAGGTMGGTSSGGAGGESGGRAGSGGIDGGGRGATGGSAGGGGEFPVPAFPCLNEGEFSPDLVRCDAGFVHRPSAAACPPIPDHVRDQLEPATSGGEGGGPSIAQGCYDHICDPGEVCIWTEPDEVRFEDCARPCESDADCWTNELCACTSGLFLPALAEGPGTTLGICRPATCRTDLDCGPGMFCISNFRTEDCVSVPHDFHCQSPNDECAGAGDRSCHDSACVHDGERFVCSDSPNAYC